MPASASTNLKRQARLYDQLRGSGYELDSIDDTDPKQKHLDMKPIEIDHQDHLDQLVNDIISRTSTQQPKE